MRKQEQKGKITALYERLSHDDGRSDESVSVENQKRILEDYARKNGFTNGTQEGLSSKKSPETQQKEAQHAPFDVMLGFSSLQRFQRVKQCSVCKKHFRILPNGVKMLYAVKFHIQRRTVYALPCFAF